MPDGRRRERHRGRRDLTNCGTFGPSGVAVKRTVVLHVATRSIETKDRWVSTDGRAHDIDVLYDEQQREVAPAQNGYRFPWVDGSTFKARAAGDGDRSAARPHRDRSSSRRRSTRPTTTRATRRAR